jgi:VanZ family protein
LNRKKVYIIAGLLWFAFTFYLLTIPGQRLPQINWFNKLQGDKFVHIFLFFILCYFFSFFVKDRKNVLKFIFFISFTALLYGIAMEFVQKYYIPNRSCDVKDMLADGIGSFLSYFWWRYKIKKPR